jgi:CDP-6-deoxy-D-xylo-4-hexulose-3-dehydrase
VAGDLRVTDVVAERTFWVGCWPGLTREMLDHVAGSIRDFVDRPVRLPRPAGLRAAAGRA